jgi:hypothetical protein
MTKKPRRTPRQVMQGLQHLTLASKVTQFLDGDAAATDSPSPNEPLAASSSPRPAATDPSSEPTGPPPSLPSEPPATAAPSLQPAQKRRSKSGPEPEYEREPLWRLDEEHPDWSAKKLALEYEAKTGVMVSETWARTHRVRPRS